MRVKLTYTFSGAGSIAPIFITVMGLNDRELAENNIALKIEGLSIGGSGVTVGTKQCGYLLFMKGQKGADYDRYRHYRDNVLIPFINQSHVDYTGWREGTEIPQKLKAVSWCDGDLAQIENIVSKESLKKYKDNLIIANKKNAACSGLEQAADLTRTFKIMKKLQSTTSTSDISLINNPLKRILVEKFKQLEASYRLRLIKNHKDALIDFISSVPKMTVRAATKNNIIRGFRENGMIDCNVGLYPDFHQMLATCKQKIEVENYDLCVRSFSHLYE